MVRGIICFLTCCCSLFGLNAQNNNIFPALAEKNIIANTKENTYWKNFADKLLQIKAEGKGQVRILHLGDSHVQGGYFTNRFRDLVAKKYGMAGRGFIFPYSLVKTNGPEDIVFASGSSWKGEKYNSKLNKRTGIAGYNLVCNDSLAMLSFQMRPGTDSLYPFTELVVYHSDPRMEIVSGTGAKSFLQPFERDLYATHLIFDNALLESSLYFHSNAESFKLQGIELKNNQPGIRYDVLGTNGLTYDAYLSSLDYMPVLKALHPDCIIISLGTNDAYVANLDEAQFKAKVMAMVSSVRKELPGCCILLTTPNDHLYLKKHPNRNTLKVQSAIISTALDHQCVYWDFFGAMGGLGASKKWAGIGGMYKDVVHLSKQGYKWQGEMLYEAFINAIDGNR